MNEQLMKHIDRYFLLHPYYGVERMTDYLNMDLGYRVNEKRVRRLYKLMNLKTIYARPSTTKRDPEKHIYSVIYLLLSQIKYGKPTSLISRCSEVLCTWQQ